MAQAARRLVAALLCLACLQTAPAVAAPTLAMDASTLATGRYASMQMRLKKTFLRIPVLHITVRVDSTTASRLAALLAGQRYSDELADRASLILLGCQGAFASLVFLRDVSLQQFLDSTRQSLDQALRDGVVTPAQHREILAYLPRWFNFLKGRGFRKGDALLYRLDGQAVRTQLWSASRQRLMDRVDVGAAGRLGLLGGWFAPGTEMQKGLIRSLF